MNDPKFARAAMPSQRYQPAIIHGGILVLLVSLTGLFLNGSELWWIAIGPGVVAIALASS